MNDAPGPTSSTAPPAHRSGGVPLYGGRGPAAQATDADTRPPAPRPGASSVPLPTYGRRDRLGESTTAVAVAVLAVVLLVSLLGGLFVWQFADDEASNDDSELDTAADPNTQLNPDDPNTGGPGSSESTIPGPTQPTVPPVTSPPQAADGDVLAEVEELKTFVERERHLDFTAEVTVSVLDDVTFDQRIRETLEARRDHLTDVDRVWTTIGLFDQAIDLIDTLARTLAADAIVRYDPATNELMLRQVEVTPLVRQQLVVELTKAVNDQHFEIYRPEYDDATTEIGFGFQALVEGDATVIGVRYEEAISSSEYDELIEEQETHREAIGALGIPDAVLTFAFTPRDVGELLIPELVFLDEPMLDEAYANPPVTSEQVLHPDLYLDVEDAIEVEPPPDDGEVFDEGLFGEYLLVLMLAPALGTDAAFSAAEGWGGDWFVAWEPPQEEGADGEPLPGAPTDPGACVRADLAGDSGDDLDELEAALAEWATQVGAEVERLDSGDIVRFTVCSGASGGASSRL